MMAMSDLPASSFGSFTTVELSPTRGQVVVEEHGAVRHIALGWRSESVIMIMSHFVGLCTVVMTGVGGHQMTSNEDIININGNCI
jgi:hypothetical protein